MGDVGDCDFKNSGKKRFFFHFLPTNCCLFFAYLCVTHKKWSQFFSFFFLIFVRFFFPSFWDSLIRKFRRGLSNTKRVTVKAVDTKCCWREKCWTQNNTRLPFSIVKLFSSYFWATSISKSCVKGEDIVIRDFALSRALEAAKGHAKETIIVGFNNLEAARVYIAENHAETAHLK